MLNTVILAVSLTSFADPFVGTAGTGHTTPAAAHPFGMVQAGPDTGNGKWAYCSGYIYGDKSVIGYSQNHLSGTGCADLGDVRVLPFAGEYGTGVRAIDKASERAEPGYYAVRQPDDALTVEIAAAKRAALYRVTSTHGGEVKVMVDPVSFLYAWGSSTTAVRRTSSRLTKRGIVGDLVRNTWVTDRRMSFALEFDRDWKTVGRQDEKYFAAFDLKKGESLQFKVGLSITSSERAAANLADSIPGWDFEGLRRVTSDKWEELFARTVVEGPDELKRNFYTALYHLYYQPHDYSDAGERSYFTTLSLWDTFRAAQPWYTLVVPEIVPGICRSLMRLYHEIGRIPVMSYGGKNADCMIGNHGVPVLVDAYLKGFDIGDPEEVYAAIRNTLFEPHAGKPKENWDLYEKHGYFPYDVIEGESVSRTLECAYDDHCAALMAEKLGHREDAQKFRLRAQNWRNVFDPSLGLVRGRDSHGKWREPFDPFRFGGGGNWQCYDCTEGNAWQYTWHVMQDPDGLIAALGGRDRFVEKLDSVFRQRSGEGKVADVTGCIGQYVHGNEPSHHVAYFYVFAGRSERTEEIVRDVIGRFYKPRPDGLCGNDDCGQMSAWYVFSALGFYPFDPCGGKYVRVTPQVPKATLYLANGRTFTVSSRDGAPRTPFLSHQDILAGDGAWHGLPDFVRKGCVVSDTNRYTCGSGSVSCVLPDGRFIYAPYLASTNGYGECHDGVALAEIPVDDPSRVRNHSICQAGDSVCGVPVTNVLSYGSLLWRGKVRVYIDINFRRIAYRDWDPETGKVVGEGWFKCRWDGEETEELSKKVFVRYLASKGFEGYAPTEEGGDRCIWQSKPQWRDGGFYGFVTSSRSPPILFHCRDGETFEFVGILPADCEYECQLAILDGGFYAVLRGAEGDNFWTSFDGGRSWKPSGRLPDGLQRQQMLVWRDKVLVCCSAPDERPNGIRNGRNNIHLLWGKGPDLSKYEELLHAIDPLGIVYPDLIDVGGDLYVLWSNSARFPTHVKWGAVQGKDQILFSKLELKTERHVQ